MTHIAWLLLVTIHALGCCAVAGATIALPFELGWSGWHVWLPVGMLVVNNTFDRHSTCLFTDIENYLRRRMGWQPINSFIRHYLGGGGK